MNSENKLHESSIGQRFKAEMRVYAIISLYLWVCFGALFLWETALLRAEKLPVLPLGTAAIKALILGKFILIGEATKAGRRIQPDVLAQRIVWKTLVMLLLLLLFKVIEELVIGFAHGTSASATVAAFMARPWLQNAASSVVMLLILIPIIAFGEIDNALGKGTLKRLLFGRPAPESR